MSTESSIALAKFMLDLSTCRILEAEPSAVPAPGAEAAESLGGPRAAPPDPPAPDLPAGRETGVPYAVCCHVRRDGTPCLRRGIRPGKDGGWLCPSHYRMQYPRVSTRPRCRGGGRWGEECQNPAVQEGLCWMHLKSRMRLRRILGEAP